MAFVMPWNFSVMALGFLLQTSYCSQDLQNVEKKAWLLTKFTDYILSQNADSLDFKKYTYLMHLNAKKN
jgi:hypothetical protein